MTSLLTDVLLVPFLQYCIRITGSQPESLGRVLTVQCILPRAPEQMLLDHPLTF